jgi:hypothetical protein
LGKPSDSKLPLAVTVELAKFVTFCVVTTEGDGEASVSVNVIKLLPTGSNLFHPES